MIHTPVAGRIACIASNIFREFRIGIDRPLQPGRIAGAGESFSPGKICRRFIRNVSKGENWDYICAPKYHDMIALICEQPGNLFEMARQEDKHLLSELSACGFIVEAKDWKDTLTDWTTYDAVILKSPYDYHTRLDEFMTWLEKLSALGVRLLNPAGMVTWNADKHYLKEIAAAGFNIIPSIFLEKGETEALSSLFDQLNTDRIIVKPCVSAGSKNTFTLQCNDAGLEQHPLNHLLQEEAFIAQPFLPEIYEGEWSLIFFGGHFSHAIIKKPKQGDFRVQPQYGGTIQSVIPSMENILKGEALIARFAKDALYTRVDGVMVNGQLALMELELIEPMLYLAYGEESSGNYLRALAAALRSDVLK